MTSAGDFAFHTEKLVCYLGKCSTLVDNKLLMSILFIVLMCSKRPMHPQASYSYILYSSQVSLLRSVLSYLCVGILSCDGLFTRIVQPFW